MIGTFDSVSEKYEFFISVLQLSNDLFVPWSRVSVKHPCLPSYLQNMLDNRSYPFSTFSGRTGLGEVHIVF